MHLPLGLPSHLSSLLSFLNESPKKKRQRKQVTKKFSYRKVSACRAGTTACRADTTALLQHSYHFANYAHHNTFYMHLAYSYALNEQGTQLCSLRSLPHKTTHICHVQQQ